MSDDIRLKINFKGHRKRRKLKKLLGASYLDYLTDIWLTVAEERPDGNISDWDDDDLLIAASATTPFKGPAHKLREALIDVGFLDAGDTLKLVVHDWTEHQPWVIGSPMRKEKNKRNAMIRWAKRDGAWKDCKGQCNSQCVSQCSLHSVSQCPFDASRNAPYPTLPYPTLPYLTLPYHTTTTTIPIDSEGNGSGSGVIVGLFNEEFGKVNDLFIEEMGLYEDKCPERWLIEAFKQTLDAKANKPWAYMKAILDIWIDLGEMRLTKDDEDNGSNVSDDISPAEYREKYSHLTRK